MLESLQNEWIRSSEITQNGIFEFSFSNGDRVLIIPKSGLRTEKTWFEKITNGSLSGKFKRLIRISTPVGTPDKVRIEYSRLASDDEFFELSLMTEDLNTCSGVMEIVHLKSEHTCKLEPDDFLSLDFSTSPVTEVIITPDGDDIEIITLKNATHTLRLWASGDCCAHAFIKKRDFDCLVGETILGAWFLKYLGTDDLNDVLCIEKKKYVLQTKTQDVEILVHTTHNGYYSGSLKMSLNEN